MSDFLLNLARRSAGLAPAVRARAMPLVVADDGVESASEPATRTIAEPATVKTIDVSPRTQTIGIQQSAVPPVASVSHLPVTEHAPRNTVQRAPAASNAAPAAPALAAGAVSHAVVVPVVAPRTGTGGTGDVVVAIRPTAVALADAARRTRSEELPTEVIYNVPRAIKADMETSLHNTSDEPNPVFVAIEPAKSPATTAPASNPTSSVERTVHVRIGAIEIHNDDRGSAPRAVLPDATTPAVQMPGALPASGLGGFAEFAALRSYAPWTW